MSSLPSPLLLLCLWRHSSTSTASCLVSLKNCWIRQMPMQNGHHLQKLSMTYLRKLTATVIVDCYHSLTLGRRECRETFTWVSNYSSQPVACNSTLISYGYKSGLEEGLERINWVRLGKDIPPPHSHSRRHPYKAQCTWGHIR